MENQDVPQHAALQNLSTEEVAEVVGVKTRTLVDWVKRRLLPVPAMASGHRRVWTQYDVLKACTMAALKLERIQPARAGRLIRDDVDLATVLSDDAIDRVMSFMGACAERARAIHAARPRKDDLRKMTGSYHRTKISRGECGFAGVCIKELTLIVSEGLGGVAYAAELTHEDAKILLADMERALEGFEDNEYTSIHAFEKAHLVVVFVGALMSIVIGAGEEGAIVARLTRDDFVAVRNALRSSLSVVGRVVEVPGIPHAAFDREDFAEAVEALGARN